MLRKVLSKYPYLINKKCKLLHKQPPEPYLNNLSRSGAFLLRLPGPRSLETSAPLVSKHTIYFLGGWKHRSLSIRPWSWWAPRQCSLKHCRTSLGPKNVIRYPGHCSYLLPVHLLVLCRSPRQSFPYIYSSRKRCYHTGFNFAAATINQTWPGNIITQRRRIAASQSLLLNLYWLGSIVVNITNGNAATKCHYYNQYL